MLAVASSRASPAVRTKPPQDPGRLTDERILAVRVPVPYSADGSRWRGPDLGHPRRPLLAPGEGRATGDVLRAVLRPRLRLRHHAAVASPAHPPHLVRCRRDRLPARRRVLGLELHDVDGQLVRPRSAGGAAGARVRDAGQLVDGGGRPRGLRRSLHAVRRQLLRAADRTQRLRRRRHPCWPVQPQLPADPDVEHPVRATVDRRGVGRRRRPLGAVVDARWASTWRLRCCGTGCRAGVPRR